MVNFFEFNKPNLEKEQKFKSEIIVEKLSVILDLCVTKILFLNKKAIKYQYQKYKKFQDK